MHWSWPSYLAVVYIVGATANHSLFLAIHELSHNLGFKSIAANKLCSMLANLPIGIPYCITFKPYHMEHHRFQGDHGEPFVVHHSKYCSISVPCAFFDPQCIDDSCHLFARYRSFRHFSSERCARAIRVTLTAASELAPHHRPYAMEPSRVAPLITWFNSDMQPVGHGRVSKARLSGAPRASRVCSSARHRDSRRRARTPPATAAPCRGRGGHGQPDGAGGLLHLLHRDLLRRPHAAQGRFHVLPGGRAAARMPVDSS
jgi:hypothetical protein